MEKEDLEREIKVLEKGLSDYLKLYPKLGVPEKERDRVINQFLDDINIRKRRIEQIE